MKMKRVLSFFMILCMVLTMLPANVLAVEWPEAATRAQLPQRGTDAPQLVDGYYEIYTADQLYWFAQQVNSGNNSINGKLMADIVVNENVLNEDGELNGDGSNFRAWTPIGNSGNKFNGTFDGNGRTVSGLYFNDDSASYVGLFGHIGHDCAVKNVGVSDSYFCGFDCVGSIVGFSDIQKYWYTDDSDWSYSYFDYSSISNCVSYATVSGEQNVGGVVGKHGGVLSNCLFAGCVLSGASTGAVIGAIYIKYQMDLLFPEEFDSDSEPEVNNSYYITDCVTDGNAYGNAMSAEQFASGEVAYLLQGSQADLIWGQSIGIDPYPVLGGAEVLYQDGIYFNESISEVPSLVDGNYLIYTADQLYWFAQQVNGGNTSINGKLMANITVNESVVKANHSLNGDGSNFRVWTPIGLSGYDYNGVFDGNEKTIFGLYINDTSMDTVDFLGLFGYVGAQGVVKNLTIADSYMSGDISGDDVVGGFAGRNLGTIENCCNMGTINNYYSGGVVYKNDGIVNNCCNAGYVYGYYSAGVVTYNRSTITNCYNVGNVDGGDFVGGIVAYNSGEIENCFSFTGVGGETGGAIVGGYPYGTVRNSYYLTGTAPYDGAGIAKTQAQFASGEVAYLLGEAFGQNLGVQAHPVVGGRKVVLLEGYYFNDSGCVHVWKDATCITPKTCTKCGITLGETVAHDFVGGLCRWCGDYENVNDGVYEIFNAAQLYWFAERVNGGNTSINGKLMADIVVNENVLKADGTLNGDGSNFRTWTTMSSFSGTFDGNRHTISGLYMNGTSSNCGFVGSLSSSGTVMNLGIMDSYFSGGSYVGGIAADNDGVISCCYTSVTITSTYYSGGIAGENDGTIINCGNTGKITANYAGVGASYYYAGGIAGRNGGYGSIGNCFSVATLSGRYTDGITTSNSGYVVNSYATTGVTSRIKRMSQFVSGEVAYLLQGDQADQVWGQIIGTDGAPVLFGEPIYYLGGHYSNGPANSDAHYYVNGICAGCGAFEAPVVKNGVAEIYTANQLYWYANQVNLGVSGLHGKLMANITINGSVLNADGTLRNGTFREWVPIGTSERPFIGTFAGNGFTISGLFMDTTEDHVGLFGYISKGVVKNVVIADSYFSGGSCVGSVVGYNHLGIIKDCYTRATVDGESAVGGVVGYSYSDYSEDLGSIILPSEDCFDDDDCYNCNGGEYYVGKCYFVGRVNGSGIIGVFEDQYLSEGGSVDCYYLSGAANGGINGQDITGKAEPKEAEFFDCNNIELIPHSWFSADCDSPRVCTICGASDSTASLHNYVDGCCTRCGMTEIPALVDGCYEIYTADHLYWFAAKVNGGSTSIKGKLMADIVVNRNVLKADGSLNGDGSNFRVWTPIGNSGKKYTGTFDGNGKTISGLYFNASVSYVGLFGYLGDWGKIKNVGIVDSYLKGYNYVGGVAGYFSDDWYYGEVVSNCYNSGTVIGNDFVGGIVGSGDGDEVDVLIKNCYNTGSVSGHTNVGGVIGYSDCPDDLCGTIVRNCYNTGSVSGSGYYVGGVVGHNGSGSVIICYNTGSVSGSGYYVGGVVGYNDSGYVSDCYYLTGCAKDGAGKVQNGLGNAAKGSATADASGKTTGKNAAQFASGEVAYLLQGSQTEQIWGQLIGTDPSPVLGGEKVYMENGAYFNNLEGACKHNYQTVVTKPTCTTDGYTTYTCTKCGDSYQGNTVMAPGHSWMDANCQSVKTCTVCGLTQGNLGAHAYNKVVTAPTCTTDGYTTYTCKFCADTYRSNFILATGHNWADPSCTDAMHCITCGLTLGNPMGHHFGEVVVHRPTPNAQGYSEHCCVVCGFSEKFDYVSFKGVTVSGTVTGFLEGNVTVALLQGGNVIHSVTAGGEDFTIDGVQVGEYTLRVSKINHVTREFAVTVDQQTGKLEIILLPVGDITGDGVVNTKDFARLLRYINKTDPLTDYELACGDVTGDGVVNIKDFQRLLRHVNKTSPLY